MPSVLASRAQHDIIEASQTDEELTPMTRHSTNWLAAGLLALSFTAAADASNEARTALGGDVFVGGQEVRIQELVAGDLFVAGGRVDVDADVTGDLLALGGQLRLRRQIGRSVFAGGGQVQIEGEVGQNLRVMGGQMELAPAGKVLGNVSAVGGQVRLLGEVAGHVMVAGGDVRIDGPVAGNVTATTGELTLGPNARIAGRLRYRSGQELTQAPGAQVAGGIEKLLPSFEGDDDEGRSGRDHGHSRGLGWSLAGAWTLGLMLVAAALVAGLPGLTARVSTTLRQRTGISLLLGFGVLVCVPVAVVVLMITVIGLPLALTALALYLALLPVAYAASAIGLGDMALQRWRPAQTSQRGWRIGAASLALLLLALIGWVPIVGGVIGLLMMLGGLGAVAMQIARPAREVA